MSLVSCSGSLSQQPGIIEGFYGRPWPLDERLQLLQWMPAAGFGTYVYAPKADAHLRRQWRHPHPESVWQSLQQLRQAARDAGVSFGLGLSPWGLQQQMTAGDRAALRAAVTRLNALEPDWLGILFDDMPGGQLDLAERQLAVVHEILSVSSAAQHAVCPTYYSQDPILDELFGPCPENYLESLSEGLPACTALLWTGPAVVTRTYRAADFDWIAARSARPVMLWDNSAVNDGRRTSEFLPLRPFRTDPELIRAHCVGHLVNPMSQAALARTVLSTLGAWYQQPARDAAENWQRVLEACPPALAALLARDADCFEHRGLSALSAAQRVQRTAEYRRVDHPVAHEIGAWLAGEYVFDPNCLND